MNSFPNMINNLRGDRIIWIVFGLLCLASLLAVYSSAGIMEYRFGGGGSHIMKHVLIVLVGGFIVYVLHQLPFRLYSAMAPRSEERRVGKECRCRRWECHSRATKGQREVEQ